MDWWKEPDFDPEKDVKYALLEESSFKILIPAYRVEYMNEIWPHLDNLLTSRGIKAEINAKERIVTVATTEKTRDPYVIIRARDMVKLISRSVPFVDARRVVTENLLCDVIKIGNILNDKERFARRRQRLIGPNGATLKAIELLTKTTLCVSGRTVAVMGTSKGLVEVRKLVLECMNNVHPVYNIKRLMIQHELSKQDHLKNTDWSKWLPKFVKTPRKKYPKAARGDKKPTDDSENPDNNIGNKRSAAGPTAFGNKRSAAGPSGFGNKRSAGGSAGESAAGPSAFGNKRSAGGSAAGPTAFGNKRSASGPTAFGNKRSADGSAGGSATGAFGNKRSAAGSATGAFGNKRSAGGRSSAFGNKGSGVEKAS